MFGMLFSVHAANLFIIFKQLYKSCLHFGNTTEVPTFFTIGDHESFRSITVRRSAWTLRRTVNAVAQDGNIIFDFPLFRLVNTEAYADFKTQRQFVRTFFPLSIYSSPRDDVP